MPTDDAFINLAHPKSSVSHATRERILASVKIFKIVVTLLVKGRISCGVVVFLVPD